MSVPLSTSDPAYWMLKKGADEKAQTPGEFNWRTKPVDHIYDPACFICRDPEFALMGMPLCKPCQQPVPGPLVDVMLPCGRHVRADEDECDRGHSAYENYLASLDQDARIGEEPS